MLIVVVICLLFANTTLKEFLKIPILMEHYTTHVQENPQITFYHFLVDHYSNIPHSDFDEKEDNKLPFKDLSLIHMDHQFHIFINTEANDLAVLDLDWSNQNNTTYYKSFAYNSYLTSFWQPPKHNFYI